MKKFLEFMFEPSDFRVKDRWRMLVFTVIFLIGVCHWTYFFRYGCGSLTFYSSNDWPEEYKYYSVLKEAVTELRMPYFTSEKLQLLHPTDHFMAIPEVITVFSPQVVLLRFLNIKDFVLIDVLLLYTIGFWGCLRIASRYRFSPFVFLVLFTLFNLNGYMTCHMAAGHSMWTSYFFLPFLILPLLQMSEKEFSSSQPVQIALAIGAMSLQGGLHICLWSFGLLGLMFLFMSPGRLAILVAGILAVLLSAADIFPALMTFKGGVLLLPGFPDLWIFVKAFVAKVPWFDAPFRWEYCVNISIMGVVFLLVFGLLSRFHPSSSATRRNYRYFELAILIITLLSFNENYYWVAWRLHLQNLLTSQRVPSRFIIIPVVLLAVIACIRAQSWINAKRVSAQWRWIASGLLLGGLAMIGFLTDHTAFWRMQHMERWYGTGPIDWTAAAPHIVDGSSPLYVWSVKTSLMVSAATLLGIIGIFLWRVARRFQHSGCKIQKAWKP